MSSGEIILYVTEDGKTNIQLRAKDGSVWLTQAEMAELFQTSPQNITLHIKSIYNDNELYQGATCKEYLQVRTEGQRQIERNLKHYNLDVILAVGYRVQSPRGTAFRQWATTVLKEYLIKGFAMDDARLKNPGEQDYFDELLARIRDIRSSEKVFWRKVLNIYATSIDYDPNIDLSKKFFKIVQNKMHWAAHGHTAAEIIVDRADASKPNMGLTSYYGQNPQRTDIGIAKNYLQEDELDTLNRIVSFYLEFAELQAKNRRAMHMKDWITKLDDFLRLSERDILTHAGKITNNDALAHANNEFDKFKKQQLEKPSPVEEHFERALKELDQIER